MLDVFEASAFATRELFLPALDSLHFIGQWIFRWRQAPHCGDVPADRRTHCFRATNLLQLAEAVQFCEIALWQREGIVFLPSFAIARMPA